MPAAITMSSLGHRLGRRWVLRGLNASCAAGTAVLLTGHNGAGKTTLLRILATALRPHRGSVRLFDKPAWPDPQPLRRGLGLLTHQHYFYEGLSAAQNLSLVARLAGLPEAGQDDCLRRCGLQAAQDVAVGAFSAGMKRRLGLARLLLLQPRLVLLDEPFGQLDADGVRLMEQTVQAFVQAQATVVVCTHDVARGKALCRDHWHLHDGTLQVLA